MCGNNRAVCRAFTELYATVGIRGETCMAYQAKYYGDVTKLRFWKKKSNANVGKNCVNRLTLYAVICESSQSRRLNKRERFVQQRRLNFVRQLVWESRSTSSLGGQSQ